MLPLAILLILCSMGISSLLLLLFIGACITIGCYLNGKTTVKECRWNGSRMENRLDTVKAALEMLKERLVERCRCNKKRLS